MWGEEAEHGPSSLSSDVGVSGVRRLFLGKGDDKACDAFGAVATPQPVNQASLIKHVSLAAMYHLQCLTWGTLRFSAGVCQRSINKTSFEQQEMRIDHSLQPRHAATLLQAAAMAFKAVASYMGKDKTPK